MRYTKHLFGELATKERLGCARLFRSLAHRALRAVATLLVFGAWLTQQAAIAVTLPPGFQESVFASGLIEPTALRFAPDGRIFVAEKRGVVKVFANLNATTATTLIDLRTNVYNFWDRGLLGLAVHPNFPSTPYVYVLYTYDGDVGQANAPKYGTPNTDSDPCPTPPGATDQGCIVSGRLSRFTVLPNANGVLTAGPEQVLIHDWCQQFPSHSIGDLLFGHDGALYVSAGDGASFNYTDYGQTGNPCGDPLQEGGALRSQDLRTLGDPVTLSGAILRIDPNTGAGLSSNPMGNSADANARRILAHGLRNPFRITLRPGTNNEIWIGDVGWNTWEEIDAISNTWAGSLFNFGWPCYEGNSRQSGYETANLAICQNLYSSTNAVRAPYFTYAHSARVVPNETCPTGASAVGGVAFQAYSGGSYPARYNGALFFADYSRKCIWAMLNGSNGLPNPATIENFAVAAANPVDLKIAPNGELFYVDLNGGAIRRIQYAGAGNQPPTARISATPTSGAVPLTVSFNGSTSSDPDPGDTLTYAWDLNGDGLFDNGSGVTASFTYNQAGTFTPRLRVTDSKGASSTASTTITAGSTSTPPTATITSPAAGTTWKVGDTISFSGSATDAQDGTLPASRLSWKLSLFHCDTNCHVHVIQTYSGVASGTFVAPDHGYPSYLELSLTATDSTGLTATKTLRLDPRTVVLTFQSAPNGLPLTVGSSASTTPFTRTVIIGSQNSVSAPVTQNIGTHTYTFRSWSDGGAQTHIIVAPAVATTYTARYRK